MNICIFTGRVGRDPESRQTPSGQSILSWPLAVDTGSRDKPATMWLECALWGNRAETLAPYIAKGKKITVSDRLAQEDYQAKDGSTKTKLRFTVDQVELPPKDGDAAPAAAPRPQSRVGGRVIDDDMPF